MSLLETKVKEMSPKVVCSLGAGRFLDWAAVDAVGAAEGYYVVLG